LIELKSLMECVNEWFKAIKKLEEKLNIGYLDGFALHYYSLILLNFNLLI